MAKAKYFTQNNEKVYPISHTKAVYDGKGKVLEDRLTEDETAISSLQTDVKGKADKTDVDNKLNSNSAISDTTVAFTEASARENIVSNEKSSTLFGKVQKWFSDLKKVAFTGSYNDLIDTPSNATTTINGLMSSSDKTKLNGIASHANNYTHPSTHAASMITQDSTHRFVSDTEKTTWNNKISPDTDADGHGYLWSDIATNFIDLDNTLSSHGFAGASEVMMFLAYLTWNYGTCSTSAATSAKTVTLSHFSDNSGAGLWNGNRVFIKFTYANTASSPTLNINGLGAKTIKWGNTTSRTNNYMWQAGEVVEFVYDGTYWVAISSTSATQGYFTDNVTIKNNTNYGTKLNFGDGDYVHIAEVYDDAMELKGSNIHLGIETSKAVWLQSSNSSTTKYKVVGTSTGYNTKIHVATSQPSTMSVGDIWFKISS